MKKIISSLILGFISLVTFANDGVYMTSGNQLVPLQETTISVKKEILTISLTDKRETLIDVYYEFYNPTSSDKTLLMGFEADPSYNDDYKLYANGKHKNIHSFSVEMNGKRLSYKNAVCNLESKKPFDPLDLSKWKYDDENGMGLVSKTNSNTRISDYAYVYYFNATFKPGINKVHHTYSYANSGSVGNAFHIPYKLSPAARWANKQIDEFKLIIRADNTAKHIVVNKSAVSNSVFAINEGEGKIRSAKAYGDDVWELSLRNGAAQVTLNAFSPQPENELNIMSADAIYVFNDYKFGSTYDRSSALELYTWWQYRGEKSQKLTFEEFKRIARNLPYASRGHVFKDAKMKEYFESLWWYMPDPSYKDNTLDFTETDKYYLNIKESEFDF